MAVGSVSSDCSLSCSKTPWFDNVVKFVGPLAPGELIDLSPVPCAWNWLVDVTSPDGLSTVYARGATLPLAEHGVYTLVVGGSGGGAPGGGIALLTDAAPPSPTWLPLVIAPLLLLAAGAAHAAVGYLLRCFARVAPPAKVAAGAAEAGVFANLLAFFGWDAAVRAGYAAAAKEASADAAAAAGGSINGGGALRESLLNAEEGAAPAAASSSSSSPSSAPAAPTTTKPMSAGRVHAVDVLRGLALCFMIFVNYGGGGYSFLDHAAWNGLHLADLLFPTFVWTQGVSMAISFAAARRRGATAADLAQRVAWRSAKLYALGCFLNGGTDLYNWRVIGVLQYFAVSYLVVGCVEAFLPPSADVGAGSAAKAAAAAINDGGAAAAAAAAAGEPDYDGMKFMSLADALTREVGRYWKQWLAMACVAALYIGLQQGLPLPDGCPTGYTGPGGAADHGAYKTCTGGAHRVVDVALFGENHMYHDVRGGAPISTATCADVFGCAVYDPEGALGWLSACWVTFLGLQAGRVLVHLRPLLAGGAARGGAEARASHVAVVVRWALWGVPLALLGGALAGFSQDGGAVPINKNLWSPSFVLVLAGIDFLALAALYALVDVARAWAGAPFLYAGVNSIVVYVGSELFDGIFPFRVYLRDGYGSHAAQLFSNIFGVLAWLAVARILFLKKIFVNL